MQKHPTGRQPKNCFRDPKSPYWQYDFSIAGERERSSTRERTAVKAAAFVEARKAAMRRRHAAAAYGLNPAGPKFVSLFDACEAYEEKLGKVDKTTTYQIGNICALLCEEGQDRMLHDITTADFVRYRTLRRSSASRRGGPVAHSSVNREIELARRVWKHAIELDFDVGRMPNWKAVILRHEEVQRTRELRVDEEARLHTELAATNPDLLKLAMFAVITGQRKAAIIGLRWSDVDLQRREAKFVLKGRGETKDEHPIPLHRDALAIIQSCPRVSPFVFTYECKRRAPARRDRAGRVAGQRYPFSLQGWSRQWREALSDAQIEDFRWHDFRHTAATRLLRSSNNVKLVQKLLGHRTIEQTARYAHVTHDDLRRALEKMTDTEVSAQDQIAA